MNIIIVKNLTKDKIYQEVFKSHFFLELDSEKNINNQILSTMESKNIFWLDWSKKEAKDISLESLQILDINYKIFIVFSDADKTIPKIKNNHSIKISNIDDNKKKIINLPSETSLPPYPNFNTILVTKQLKLPWNAIYLEYFWTGISNTGKVELFNNYSFELKEEDVALFIWMSRYLTKIESVFNLDKSFAKKIHDIGHTFTYIFHGVNAKLPISNPDDLLKNFNFNKKFDYEKIRYFFSDPNDDQKLSLDFGKAKLLANNVSDFLKKLNLHYWILSVIARRTLEKNEKKFIEDQGQKTYDKCFSMFAGLEHSADFIFNGLYEFTKQRAFRQLFTIVEKYK